MKDKIKSYQATSIKSLSQQHRGHVVIDTRNEILTMGITCKLINNLSSEHHSVLNMLL